MLFTLPVHQLLLSSCCAGTLIPPCSGFSLHCPKTLSPLLSKHACPLYSLSVARINSPAPCLGFRLPQNPHPKASSGQTSAPTLVGKSICYFTPLGFNLQVLLPPARPTVCILHIHTVGRACTRRSGGSVVYRMCNAASPLTRPSPYSHAHSACVPGTGFQMYRMRPSLVVRAA